MTSTATVSIDRTSLTLSALAITDDGATYQLKQDGLTRPAITWRLTSVPDSINIHGTEYIGVAKEQTSIPLEVIVKSTTSSALNTAVVALETALSQFTYTVTVTVDGVAKVWTAGPASWSFPMPTGPSDVAQFFTLMTVSIPVYPIAS